MKTIDQIIEDNKRSKKIGDKILVGLVMVFAMGVFALALTGGIL